jgi:hypothetical protein
VRSEWKQEGPKDEQIAILFGLEGLLHNIVEGVGDSRLTAQKALNLVGHLALLSDYQPDKWPSAL